MNINKASMDLIKSFEGLRLKSYKCPADKWTVGYGLTTAAGIGVSVVQGMEITKPQADFYLLEALNKFSAKIRPGMKHEPTDNQFGAMLSLAYNIGPGAFLTSTCLRRFNNGDIAGAAEALTWFNKGGGRVLKGLVRRRNAERELFLSEGLTDAPVNLIQPTPAPVNSPLPRPSWLSAIITAILRAFK